MAHLTAFSRLSLLLIALGLSWLPGCDDGPRTLGEQGQAIRRAFCENGLEAVVVRALSDESCESGPYRYQITFEVVANDPRGRSGRFPDVGGTFFAVWSTPLDTDQPQDGEESCYHNVIEGEGRCPASLRREPHLNMFNLVESLPAEPTNTCVALQAQPIYRSVPLLLSNFTPEEAHDIIATEESCARGADLLLSTFA